jgi:CheY-like chemotaxis protein/anti-sigma regulatory factor (Ser/Thr protein kinase)
MYLTSDGRQVERVNRPVDSILIIDDELALLEMLQTVLSTFGYEVTIAADVDEAEGILTRQGTQAFGCVLTDYKMPGRTGLDLLRWLRHFDPDLSIVVNTGYASHEDVSAMIREGAVDVLRKPVQMDILRQALAHGVRQTRITRRRSRAEKAVAQVGVVQGYMLRIMGIRDLPWVNFFSRPVHTAGGDFAASYPREDGGNLLIMADVAGHNLDAAYISAFFHGALHGMSFADIPAQKMMNEINSFLLTKWNDRELGESLEQAPEASVCALFVEIDKDRKNMVCRNNGLPPPILTLPEARTSIVGAGNTPLGLYEEIETCVDSLENMEGASLLCFSDGLEDFARAQRISFLALACRLRFMKESEREELLSDADDDIMLARIGMAGFGDNSFIPVLVETYTGDKYKEIDGIEDSWSRSLQYALPSIPEDRLYAILLTAREAMLNALKHGCDGSEDKKADFHVHYRNATHTIRIMIRDNGNGYDDDFLTNPNPDMEKERHSGLVLIRNFPDKVWTERRNTIVYADFSWN